VNDKEEMPFRRLSSTGKRTTLNIKLLATFLVTGSTLLSPFLDTVAEVVSSVVVSYERRCLTVLPPHSFYLGYSFLLSPGSKMRVATIFTVLTAIALFDVIFARRHTPAWKRANGHHHHRRHSYVLAFISCVHPEGVTFSS